MSSFFRLAYKSIFIALGLGFSSLASAFFVNVNDVIAGEEATLHMSGLTADEAVTLTLDRPDQASLNFTLQADSNGLVQDELYGLHLKHSGSYQLTAVRASGAQRVSDSFSVVPGAPSRYRSSVVTNLRAVPADGVALVPLTVEVLDAYGNPVPGQSVAVFSSRNDDVVNVSGTTDKNGLAKGTVLSSTPGVSVLSALVGDTMLHERSEVVFHLPETDGLLNVGQSGIGSFLKAQLFSDDFEEVAYFTIENLASEITTETGYTFSVLAKDTNGKAVKNYVGTVRFSSDDNGVQLPIDYTFAQEDQGEHEFAVAVAFATPGKRTLTVTDVEDSSLQGQVQLNVVDKDRVVQPPVGNQLAIISPIEGTFSSPRMTVTGRGEPGTSIKITDGPITLVEDLSLDINGDFFYQTPALADGRHVFRAETMDGVTVSNVVEIRIDNTPPRVLAVEVDPPNGVGAGGIFRVSVSSNEALATASCTFNGVPTTLARAGDVFVGDIVAGQECGTWPLSCKVADVLGNELQENAAANVQVCGTQPVAADTDGDGLTDQQEGETNDEDSDGVPDWLESNLTDSTGNGIVDQKDPTNDTDGGGQSNAAEAKANTDPLVGEDDQAPTDLSPTAVSSFYADPGEKRITLYWSPAKDDQGIASYKVLFGPSPNNLYGINLTPDNRTQWYVDRLDEATKYFFRVIAVDTDGNEGTPSNLVEATTFGEVLHSAAVPESGSEDNLWLPLIIALLGGGLFLAFGRRRT